VRPEGLPVRPHTVDRRWRRGDDR